MGKSFDNSTVIGINYQFNVSADINYFQQLRGLVLATTLDWISTSAGSKKDDGCVLTLENFGGRC
jgi:hypothetical protein